MLTQILNRRRIMIVILLALFMFLLYFYMWQNVAIKSLPWHGRVMKSSETEDDNRTLIDLLDISESEMKSVPEGKSIFFLETSGILTVGNVIRLKDRQACAVESAAKTNPTSTIFLFYLIPKTLENDTIFLNNTDSVQRHLYNYENIRIRRLNLNKYMMGTPLERWHLNDTIRASWYPIEHTSDVLRYLTLWKYGGTYMDLDFVVMRNLDDLESNYAVAEQSYMSNAILNFGLDPIGHEFANECLREIDTNYRGNDWGYNGPQLVLRVLKKRCNTDIYAKMIRTNCKGFNVLQPPTFYPVPWGMWGHLFEPQNRTEILEMVNSAHAVHIWNKLNENVRINTTQEEVGYGSLAKRYCPNVYSGSGEDF